MDRFLYIAAGIAGFITAAMGAYGVHGLKPRISPELYGMFETAVRYQMFHALAMFAAAWGWVRWRHRAFGAAGVLFILGMVFVSFAIYVRVLAHAEWTTVLAPLGGLTYFAGWLCLAFGALRGKGAAG